MTETLEKGFIATHMLNGVPVMRNPEIRLGRGGNMDPKRFWVDGEGNYHRTGPGSKATLLSEYAPDAPPIVEAPSYTPIADSRSVLVSREAAAIALRACAWPDSAAPCGHAGNSNDDDATCVGYDREDCIVKLFIRGKGYYKVRIPKAMYLEIVDE